MTVLEHTRQPTRAISSFDYHPDGNGIDRVSGVPIYISHDLHEGHEGKNYFIKTFLADVGGNGSTTVFSFTTPNTTTRVHAKSRMTPDADYEISIYEGATVTGGVAVVGINNDRDSTNTAELTAKSGPTVSVAGTKIWTARNGGGKDPVGVAPGLNYEIIAKTNTTYVFELIKRVANQPQYVDIDFWWHEHAPQF